MENTRLIKSGSKVSEVDNKYGMENFIPNAPYNSVANSE